MIAHHVGARPVPDRPVGERIPGIPHGDAIDQACTRGLLRADHGGAQPPIRILAGIAEVDRAEQDVSRVSRKGDREAPDDKRREHQGGREQPPAAGIATQVAHGDDRGQPEKHLSDRRRSRVRIHRDGAPRRRVTSRRSPDPRRRRRDPPENRSRQREELQRSQSSRGEREAREPRRRGCEEGPGSDRTRDRDIECCADRRRSSAESHRTEHGASPEEGDGAQPGRGPGGAHVPGRCGVVPRDVTDASRTSRVQTSASPSPDSAENATTSATRARNAASPRTRSP